MAVSLNFRDVWQALRRYEYANQGLRSEDFYDGYCSGKYDPSPAAMRWATLYEAFLELAPAVETSESDSSRLLVSA